MTEEAFQTDITKEVQTNLTTELILEAIAKKEGIKLEEEAFQDYVQQQMDVNAYKSAEEFYKSGGSDAAAGEKHMNGKYSYVIRRWIWLLRMPIFSMALCRTSLKKNNQ